MAKILLIDDDAVLLKLYSTKLIADGHQVEIASDGEVGLKIAQAFMPQTIVLDLLMPKLNGFGFLDAVKKIPQLQNTQVIVFSSVASDEQLLRLKEMGVKMYLNKIDTTPTQLVETIKQMLS